MPRVKSLCVTHGIVSATWHCNATCQCHYQMYDFDLVPIYIFSFQFSTYLCVFDSILT